MKIPLVLLALSVLITSATAQEARKPHEVEFSAIPGRALVEDCKNFGVPLPKDSYTPPSQEAMKGVFCLFT